MAKQALMDNVLPKLTEEQDAALSLADALYELEVKKEQADKRKEELMKIMARKRKDRVVVMDGQNFRHTFEYEPGKPKLKHNARLEQTTEKAEGSDE